MCVCVYNTYRTKGMRRLQSTPTLGCSRRQTRSGHAAATKQCLTRTATSRGIKHTTPHVNNGARSEARTSSFQNGSLPVATRPATPMSQQPSSPDAVFFVLGPTVGLPVTHPKRSSTNTSSTSSTSVSIITLEKTSVKPPRRRRRRRSRADKLLVQPRSSVSSSRPNGGRQ